MFRNIIFLILILFSCSKPEEVDYIQHILDNAPDAGIATFDNSANFEEALGSYRDSAIIKYAVVNNPPKMTAEETTQLIEGAIDKWANDVNKPFIRVDSVSKANIYFSFEFMDGKGGQQGQAEFPPYKPIKNWNRSIIIDAYDVNGEGESNMTIVAHELGHGLGLKDSRNRGSIMYEYLYKGQDIGIDDKMGARIIYDNKKKFTFDGRTYIPIEKLNVQMTEDFKMLEFFSRCSKFPYDFHFIDNDLVKAIQIIRYSYDVPIQILSTYRAHECNYTAGGATASRHMLAQALDFKFIGSRWKVANDAFLYDIKNKGCIFQTLINANIGGFGAYDHSFHIDTRRSGLQKWFNLNYAIWGRFSDGAFFLDEEHPNGMENE